MGLIEKKIVLLVLFAILCQIAQLLNVFQFHEWITAIASLITAIATGFAGWFAYKAYKESLKARRSSAFNALFTQLLANHKLIFDNEALKKTRFNPQNSNNEGDSTETVFGICNQENDVFANFFAYYKKCQKEMILITSNDVQQIYNTFVDNLMDGVKFSNCFKYVYYEIKTVLDEGKDDNKEVLDDKERKKYWLCLRL